ncbi:MAG: hypothetical protein KIT68_05570, partial [Phycisphaeraceae bacterium]|nr:hypothetical protein [Phycisphaeraceae bacterium]
MPNDPSIHNLIERTRQRRSLPAPIDPEEIAHMELLTAIRDGGLRLDQVDDDTLERMRSRLGADAMAALIAREPRRSAAAPAVRAGLGRRWPLALAAAVAVGVTTWALIRPAGLPGGPPEGDAPIALTWPDRHAPFVPDARLA